MAPVRKVIHMSEKLSITNAIAGRHILEPWLHAWVLGGAVPAGATDTTVAGCIRWKRAIGKPDGDLTASFVIKCYRNDGKTPFKGGPQKELRVDQVVYVFEGPHDESYFRVTYLTDSRQTTGWAAGDWRIDLNVLEVRLSSGVTWKNTIFAGRGSKAVPKGYEFYFPGGATVLPDLDVVHMPYTVSTVRAEP